MVVHSMTHPKFLHSNSTSHVSVFGAIAELLDNACDAHAHNVLIKLVRKTQPYMIISDDGEGMSPHELHKMMSFGHCSKEVYNTDVPIGHYGNGFKSGSMRIGRDALVFTRTPSYQSIGFLSQTYLERIKAIDVLVPIVSWQRNGNKLQPITVNYTTGEVDTMLNEEAFKYNLGILTKYSPYGSEEILTKMFDTIKSKGTKIVVYNLKRLENSSDKTCEFLETGPMDDIPYDIQLIPVLRDEVGVAEGFEAPPATYSLREYAAILYLDPKIEIWIQGHKVRQNRLQYSLYKPRFIEYAPKKKQPGTSTQKVTVTFGFNKVEKQHYGMMLYHRGRLIEKYVRVGMQLSNDSRGTGVLGILNVDFLKPNHSKQNFLHDEHYRLLLNILKQRLKNYWLTAIPPQTALSHFWGSLTQSKSLHQIRCHRCKKWRFVTMAATTYPELWTCKDNPDESHNACTKPEHVPVIKPLVVPKEETDLGLDALEQAMLGEETRRAASTIRMIRVRAQRLSDKLGQPLQTCEDALEMARGDMQKAEEYLLEETEEAQSIREIKVEIDDDRDDVDHRSVDSDGKPEEDEDDSPEAPETEAQNGAADASGKRKRNTVRSARKHAEPNGSEPAAKKRRTSQADVSDDESGKGRKKRSQSSSRSTKTADPVDNESEAIHGDPDCGQCRHLKAQVDQIRVEASEDVIKMDTMYNKLKHQQHKCRTLNAKNRDLTARLTVAVEDLKRTQEKLRLLQEKYNEDEDWGDEDDDVVDANPANDDTAADQAGTLSSDFEDDQEQQEEEEDEEEQEDVVVPPKSQVPKKQSNKTTTKATNNKAATKTSTTTTRSSAKPTKPPPPATRGRPKGRTTKARS
eukprot:TRINITY_DN3607_c0_g2_i1.p1 TRINITY_DN3607_c0_g2~~TRINITY_DN3607_c0_g2_i1.p1  ORF type:complete len:885 (+),score=147.41 TRINITY_DN3607_c0_g2_i1:92-2656(+)